jgi:F-type H+-transporting ATPase subunit delta
MAMTSAANEYGSALFQWAQETDTVDAVWESLLVAAEAFRDQPEYGEFLCSPAVPKAQRLEAVKEAFGGRVESQVVDFLCLLVENGRAGEFTACVSEFKTLYWDARRIVTARVTSPVALSDSQKKQLVAALCAKTGRTVMPEYVVDESLLGGVVVELDGKRYDGSVKRRLQVIKEVIQ